MGNANTPTIQVKLSLDEGLKNVWGVLTKEYQGLDKSGIVRLALNNLAKVADRERAKAAKFDMGKFLDELDQKKSGMSEKEENKIMHIALSIGTGTTLIANDVPEVMGQVNEHENRSKILVNTESKEEADRLFTGLSAGGEVEGPMGDSPWGSYAGMFRDKYGIEWIIEFSDK